MISALMTFLVVILVLAVLYWAITKLLAALGISLPPIILTVVQIIFVLIVLLALINLLGALVGGWPSLRIGPPVR